jgi:tetratricopeptide (TPR) repeat protein
MAERFLYVPSIGLVACLVMAVYAAGKRVPLKHFAPVVLCVTAAALAVRTWVQNGDWQDERAMAEATVLTSPNSFKFHELLASVLYANDPAGSNLDRAIEEVDRSVAILDSLPDSRNDPEVYRVAGGIYLAKGDFLRERDSSASSHEYQRALQRLQRSTAIYQSTRAEYDRRGGAEWARRLLAVARADQGDPEARWMLAVAYWKLGKPEEAAAAARQALSLHPVNGVAYRQIAYVFASQNRIDDAAAALIEGAFITGDPSLKSDLRDLDRSALPNTCAITAGPTGPAVNLDCDLVQKQFCAASVEVVKAAMEAERWDLARQEMHDFLHDYGCPAGPLEQTTKDFFTRP